MTHLFIDIETTGLDPSKNQILTLGILIYDETQDRVIGDEEWAIKHSQYTVTAEALRINRINLVEHDTHAQSPEKVWAQIQEFLKNHKLQIEDCKIAGHNIIAFDIPFLLRTFPELNNRIRVNNVVDTKIMAKNCQLPSTKLGDAYSSTAKEVKKSLLENAHTALSDCEMSMELYRALRERHK